MKELRFRSGRRHGGFNITELHADALDELKSRPRKIARLQALGIGAGPG